MHDQKVNPMWEWENGAPFTQHGLRRIKEEGGLKECCLPKDSFSKPCVTKLVFKMNMNAQVIQSSYLAKVHTKGPCLLGWQKSMENLTIGSQSNDNQISINNLFLKKITQNVNMLLIKCNVFEANNRTIRINVTHKQQLNYVLNFNYQNGFEVT